MPRCCVSPHPRSRGPLATAHRQLSPQTENSGLGVDMASPTTASTEAFPRPAAVGHSVALPSRRPLNILMVQTPSCSCTGAELCGVMSPNAAGDPSRLTIRLARPAGEVLELKRKGPLPFRLAFKLRARAPLTPPSHWQAPSPLRLPGVGCVSWSTDSEDGMPLLGRLGCQSGGNPGGWGVVPKQGGTVGAFEMAFTIDVCQSAESGYSPEDPKFNAAVP